MNVFGGILVALGVLFLIAAVWSFSPLIVIGYGALMIGGLIMQFGSS